MQLVFDEDTYEFHIMQRGKEPFDFNTLSGGYQAVLDVVLDIIMRMQNQTQRSFDFNLPGIVLIDEIETHLHSVHRVVTFSVYIKQSGKCCDL